MGISLCSRHNHKRDGGANELNKKLSKYFFKTPLVSFPLAPLSQSRASSLRGEAEAAAAARSEATLAADEARSTAARARGEAERLAADLERTKQQLALAQA